LESSASPAGKGSDERDHPAEEQAMIRWILGDQGYVGVEIDPQPFRYTWRHFVAEVLGPNFLWLALSLCILFTSICEGIIIWQLQNPPAVAVEQAEPFPSYVILEGDK
jgi:hypothetical protein